MTPVNRIVVFLFAVLLAAGSARAQAPTGTIAGVVMDSTSTPIAGAHLRLISRDRGLTRSLTTSEEGDYSAAALLPGVYHLTAEANGFRMLERTATVETGATTTLNLTLQAGDISEAVMVDTAAPLIQYEHHQVGGLVSRKQIEDLPLNGLNVLELAKVEPGVQPPTRLASNRNFVPALGQPVGTNGRGTAHARGFAALSGCAVTYICDVDDQAAAKGVEAVGSQNPAPKVVRDFRPSRVEGLKDNLQRLGLK